MISSRLSCRAIEGEGGDVLLDLPYTSGNEPGMAVVVEANKLSLAPLILQAKILPWFGQKGTGTQYQLPKPVQWYLDNDYLKPAGK